MLTILFATLCVVVASAETTSVSSYSNNPSNLRDYDFSGSSYLSGKSNYDLGSSFIGSAGSSPYAKSDTRYSAESSSDGTDARSSLSGSFYKSKYGSEAALNSLRPSSFHTSPSSSSSSSSSASSSSSSSSSSNSDLSPSQAASQYSNIDYTGTASHPSTSYYETNHAPSSSSEYSTAYGGDRTPAEHHHHHPYSAASAEASATQTEYASPGRPSSSLYPGYATSAGLSEYTHSRPTSYSHGSLSGPSTSSLSASEYPTSMVTHHMPHHHHHHPSAYPVGEDYPPHHIQTQPSHYKTYVTMANPSTYPSKYQTVFGAIKSLFGGGPLLSDATPSPSHVTYSSGPSSSYYSPSMMHHAHSSYPAPPSMPAAVSSSGSGYYFSPGHAASSAAYSKSYPPTMRYVSSSPYGGSSSASSSAGSSPSGKIIVIRDGGSAHSPSYPSGPSTMISGSPTYMAKPKISAYAPSSSGPTYISSGSPSSMSYVSGSPSSGYPGGYSSGASYSSGGHGGSTFLGYSL